MKKKSSKNKKNSSNAQQKIRKIAANHYRNIKTCAENFAFGFI